MTTLQELHALQGNPDLSHWKVAKLLTVVECSLLTAGIDPVEYNHLSDDTLKNTLASYKPTNWKHALLLMRSIAEAICTQEIKSPFIHLEKADYQNTWDIVEEQAKVSLENVHEVILTSTKIHRDELYKWLLKNGYFDKPVLPKVLSEATIEIITNNKDAILLLPEPTYTTPALEAVNGVIKKFWQDYDPENNRDIPKQSTVADWIKKNYPEIQANDICTYIDKICRHPNAKKGGNKKINP